MEEKTIDKQERKDKRPEKNAEETLPHCTTAASAEHARATSDDEPCDDGRTGEIDQDHTQDETTDQG